MQDKSIKTRYRQGDIFIIRDRKPTPGTNGKHPYLVISCDNNETVLTLPISSSYTQYIPIYTYDNAGRACYSFLNPFKVYPQNSNYLDQEADFVCHVSPQYLDFVIRIFQSRFIRNDSIQQEIDSYRKEFLEKYHNLPTYHESTKEINDNQGPRGAQEKTMEDKNDIPVDTDPIDVSKNSPVNNNQTNNNQKSAGTKLVNNPIGSPSSVKDLIAPPEFFTRQFPKETKKKQKTKKTNLQKTHGGGRKQKVLPDGTEELIQKWVNHEITSEQLSKKIGLAVTTIHQRFPEASAERKNKPVNRKSPIKKEDILNSELFKDINIHELWGKPVKDYTEAEVLCVVNTYHQYGMTKAAEVFGINPSSMYSRYKTIESIFF